MKSLSVKKLSFVVAILAASQSFAFGVVRNSLWQPLFDQPCACDGRLEDAIPRVFGNHLRPQFNVNFLDLEANLIDGFIADTSVPNNQKVLLWTVYTLGAYDTSNALIRAHRAGIDVRVITDGKSIIPDPHGTGVDFAGESEPLPITRDVYNMLVAEKIPVVFSDPEWTPVGRTYPPIMHEKIRIFGRKNANQIVPLVAYVSTHNDSFTDTIGHPLPSIPVQRLRQGHLTRAELDPVTFGSVQTSFLVRHAGILQQLLTNYLAQESVYGQGRGRVRDVPQLPPQTYGLHDGSVIKVAFTYGEKSINPNDDQAKFYATLGAGTAQEVRLQEFVFSYAPVQDALKVLATANPRLPIRMMLDSNYTALPYTQGRAMAGLYSVMAFGGSARILYPWEASIRTGVQALTYLTPLDKLHSKNSIVRYNGGRSHIFTGSLNLSSNGAFNKEVSFEIDTASPLFAGLMDEQWATLLTEGRVQPCAEAALYQRFTAAAHTYRADIPETPASFAAFVAFMKKLNALAYTDSVNTGILDLAARPKSYAPWVQAMGEYYASVGVGNAATAIANEAQKDIGDTGLFRVSVPSVELFMNLVEDPKMAPETRKMILDLFKNHT